MSDSVHITCIDGKDVKISKLMRDLIPDPKDLPNFCSEAIGLMVYAMSPTIRNSAGTDNTDCLYITVMSCKHTINGINCCIAAMTRRPCGDFFRVNDKYKLGIKYDRSGNGRDIVAKIEKELIFEFKRIKDTVSSMGAMETKIRLTDLMSSIISVLSDDS